MERRTLHILYLPDRFMKHNLERGFFDMFALIIQVQSHYSLYSFWMRLKWLKNNSVFVFVRKTSNDSHERPNLRIEMYQVPNLKTTGKKQQIYWESSQVFDLNVSATVCFVVDGVAKLVFLSGGHALGMLQPYNCIRLLLSVVNWRKIKCVIYNRSRTHCTENACLILLLCPAVPFYFSTFLTYYFKE